MIFASDLDRTLIYSKRFTEELKENSFQIIEEKDNLPISYMTNKQIDSLKNINKTITFIPVTTRTLEQYQRISIYQEINPKYFIVANGGRVFINGEEDKEWKQQVTERSKQLKYSLNEVKNLMTSYFSEDTFEKVRNCDNLFWMFYTKESFDDKKVTQIKKDLLNKGWTYNRTGYKIYITPNFLTKENALNYICKKEGSPTLIAAGDSNMDYNMVVNSDYGFIPLHGEIKNTDKENVLITSKEGIYAGEEILEGLLKIISKQ